MMKVFEKVWGFFPRLLGLGLLGLLLPACQSAAPAPSVVVYVSVDQVHAQPILKAFEERTGIRVQAVYDVEATKTTGLANRLLAEKSRPLADVFWNGEFSQTIFLKGQGVLAPYASVQAQDLPEDYRDPKDYWSAFGGRARIFIVNTRLLAPEQYPRSIFALLDPQRPGETMALSNPLFGTMATQAAALYAAWGPDRARDFFRQVQQRGLQVVDGNSVVKTLVAQGRFSLGLTDTDDFLEAWARQAPVQAVIPDQGLGELGTLIIPMTVALINQAPHPETGQALMDYLLSGEVEEALEKSGFVNVSQRLGKVHPAFTASGPIRAMAVSLEDICRYLPQAQKDLREIFLR